MAKNGVKWLEIAGNDFKKGWKLLEKFESGWKWLIIDGQGWNG